MSTVQCITNKDSTPPLPLALTMGDPAGIGIEIALQAWHQRHENNIPAFCLFASSKLVSERSAHIGLTTPLKVISDFNTVLSSFTDALPVYELPLNVKVEAGKPNPVYAEVVIASITQAVDQVHAGHCSAVVTNPIAKSVLYEAGFKHPGHTEFLGELGQIYFNKPPTPVMMLASQELKVIPATIHIPLKNVPQALTFESLLQVIQITDTDLRHYFNIKQPHIAVTGLNPHAGEDGALGHEEQELIIPAINEAQLRGLNVTGPYPADTIFHKAARKTYDAVVAMYHDQALIPLKTLNFDEGVNVTLGLPFVRTSPDHGTAFDIAGKGIAKPTSLIEALKLAAQMSSNLLGNKENIANHE